MALTEIHVRPDDNDANGDGSFGDPYGDLQTALDSTTKGTDGDRFNIWDTNGTDEVMSAAIDFTSYGNPTETQPVVFQGMTDGGSPGDGGIGGISGGGSVSVLNTSTLDFIHFRDMKLHNTGSNFVVRVDDFCSFINVEFENSTTTLLQLGSKNSVIGCHFHNGTSFAVAAASENWFCQNFFKNDSTNKFTAIYNGGGTGILFAHNVVSIDSSTDGLRFTDSMMFVNNTIWSNGGTGQGIIASGSGRYNMMIAWNIIAGFSGTGGQGYNLSSDDGVMWGGANYAYDNATDFVEDGDVHMSIGANVSLSADPFRDAANDDFSLVTPNAVGVAWFPTWLGASANMTQLMNAGAVQGPNAGGEGMGGAMIYGPEYMVSAY